MMWQSLYIHTADSKEIAEAVQAVLEAHGYNAYDPFPGGSGTPTGLKKMARHFVAPAVNRWVRVLGEPVEELLSETSRAIGKPMLYGWLDEETSGFALYRNGKRDDDLDALRPYVRTTFEELQRAAAGEMRMDEIVSKEPPVVILGGGMHCRRRSNNWPMNTAWILNMRTKWRSESAGNFSGGWQNRRANRKATRNRRGMC